MAPVTSAKKLRLVLAKLGLDGHDRGVRMLARELRERGCEVILLGTGLDPRTVVATAMDEDADAIGVSMLSGAHMTLLPMLITVLAELQLEIPVVAGGTISAADAQALRAQGIRAVCSVGTSVADAAQAIIDVASGSDIQAQPAGT